MSSALVQTLIGGGLAIVGGLIAAWWQTGRADDVAQRIRHAERYEAALFELNAQIAKAKNPLARLWHDVRERISRGRRGQTGASVYELASGPLDDLLDHWWTVASLSISDSAIVDAFANLHQQNATRIWHEGNMAYSQPPPQSGLVDDTQVVLDLEAVNVALTEVETQVRSRIAALTAPRSWWRRAAVSARRALKRRDRKALP